MKPTFEYRPKRKFGKPKPTRINMRVMDTAVPPEKPDVVAVNGPIAITVGTVSKRAIRDAQFAALLTKEADRKRRNREAQARFRAKQKQP